MLTYYLLSFDDINDFIVVSKELGIIISNVNEKDKKLLFHHINSSLSILRDNHIKTKDQLK